MKMVLYLSGNILSIFSMFFLQSSFAEIEQRFRELDLYARP